MGFFNGLVDTVFGGGEDAAAEKEAAGYDRANAYMQPYQQGGLDDYNKFRGDVNREGAELDSYGNPYDWMWEHAGQDPQEFMKLLMSEYSESPMARHAQEQSMKSATQGASASGTLGSGALFKHLQDNAYDISARDQDRYLNNTLSVNNRQMQYGNNLQGQRMNQRSNLWNLVNLGNESATNMGQNEIGKGQAEGRGERGNAQGWQNLIGAGMSFLPGGAGARMLTNGGLGYGASAPPAPVNYNFR